MDPIRKGNKKFQDVSLSPTKMISRPPLPRAPLKFYFPALSPYKNSTIFFLIKRAFGVHEKMYNKIFLGAMVITVG